MLAPYGTFLLSIVWAVWSFGGLGSAGLTWWNLLWLLPLLVPFGTLHKKRWVDTDARQDAPAGAAGPTEGSSE